MQSPVGLLDSDLWATPQSSKQPWISTGQKQPSSVEKILSDIEILIGTLGRLYSMRFWVESWGSREVSNFSCKVYQNLEGSFGEHCFILNTGCIFLFGNTKSSLALNLQHIYCSSFNLPCPINSTSQVRFEALNKTLCGLNVVRIPCTPHIQ